MSIELLAQQLAATPPRAPSFMRPSGAPASIEATLGWWLAITACGIVVIVSAFLIASLFRKRVDDTNDVERRNPVAAVAWTYVGVAVTVVILIGSFIGAMVTLARASCGAMPGWRIRCGPRTIIMSMSI